MRRNRRCSFCEVKKSNGSNVQNPRRPQAVRCMGSIKRVPHLPPGRVTPHRCRCIRSGGPSPPLPPLPPTTPLTPTTRPSVPLSLPILLVYPVHMLYVRVRHRIPKRECCTKPLQARKLDSTLLTPSPVCEAGQAPAQAGRAALNVFPDPAAFTVLASRCLFGRGVWLVPRSCGMGKAVAS